MRGYPFLRLRRYPSALGRILRHQPGAEIIGVGDGGGEADGFQLGRKSAQPRKAKREKIAALVGDDGVELVENHRVEAGKEFLGARHRDQQRDLLGRGEQDVGGIKPLALAAMRRRVARTRFQAHGKLHLLHRLREVAADVDGKRLQRRDVERVQAVAVPRLLLRIAA